LLQEKAVKAADLLTNAKEKQHSENLGTELTGGKGNEGSSIQKIADIL
jgi:hypothetical protein